MRYRTRFAPSPTGLLHVGNAYSALCCARWAKLYQAELLLRIEDIDHTRCKTEYADAILEDLHWLGLRWQPEIRYQSQCSELYQQAMSKLRDMQLIYPCFCTRKEIKQEIERIASAPHAEEAQSEYPGTCKNRPLAEQTERMQHEGFAWRLNVKEALASVGRPLSWQGESGRKHAVNISHDIVIGRKDITFSYHLAVVIDDASQGITHIIRGNDLRDSTGIHRLLQALLGLPEPVYIHHALLCDSDGERLAKRHGSMTLQGLRKMGVEAQKLRSYLSHSEPLIWPFRADEERKVLDMLGNTY